MIFSTREKGVSSMQDLFHNVFKDKTVLITGHTGFKGSWLAIWLRELGASVVGYALDPDSSEGNFNICHLDEKLIDIRGDIRDYEHLQEVFNTYKPSFVFHLAAQPIVSTSYEKPYETYEINVMGTLNILRCIKNMNYKVAAVMITTDKCYENNEQIWGYRETDKLGGYDPYSSSKACAEILISSFRNSYFNINNYNIHKKAVASARAGNVIGGGDWAENRIVPDCIRSLQKGKAIEVRNPVSVRPWQHVLEPLYGYLLLAEKLYSYGPEFSSAWNFGPDRCSCIKVFEIVECVIKCWGYGKWIDISGKQAAHEANLLYLDCAKSRSYLGWKSSLDIKQAIELTVEWYKNYNSCSCYELCVDQIYQYTKSLLNISLDNYVASSIV